MSQAGQFPGRLVCLRSGKAFVPATAQECEPTKRVFALEMQEDRAMRPLIAGNEQVHTETKDFLGKDVVVMGRYHTDTRLLIASGIEPKETSAFP